MTNLEERMAGLMELAKGFLEKEGLVATVAVFERFGLQPVIQDLNMSDEEAEKSHRAVQAVILTALPDMVFVVSDAWMANGKNKDLKGYQRGWVEKQLDKKECLIVVGGSIEGVKSIIQPYRRGKGKKIVYDKLLKQGEIESAFFGNAWEIRRQAEIKRAEKEVEKSVVH